MRQFQSLLPVPAHRACHPQGARFATIATTLLLVSMLATVAPLTQAANLTLAWDPVDRAEVAGYEVHYGTSAGSYGAKFDAGNASGATLTELAAGTTYFIAVRAYSGGSRSYSPFSGEVTATTATAPPSSPQASFARTPASGVAPLTVTMTDRSTGSVASRSWDLGDGTSSTGTTVVKTYTHPGDYQIRLTVAGPGGSPASTTTRAVSVDPAAPLAAFSGSPTSGSAPLTVSFDNASTGTVSRYAWDFGDGATSTAANPSHEYATPGRYDVRLTVTGPGGENTSAKAAFVNVTPAGEELRIVRGSTSTRRGFWTKLEFDRPFNDPVVVLGPPTSTHPDPVVMRLAQITGDGFWVRAERWAGTPVPVGSYYVDFLVMERGTHQLPDGHWVEAGKFDQDLEGIELVRRAFEAPFTDTPVLTASVGTFYARDGVTTRHDAVSATGFSLTLQEQDANFQSHRSETIHYIAWEPSSGVIGNTRYEVAMASSPIGHVTKTIPYATPYLSTPQVIAKMQGFADRDAAVLRKTASQLASVGIWVDEETSRYSNVSHDPEVIGYISLGDARGGAVEPTPAPEPELVAYYRFDEGEGDTAFDYSGNRNHAQVAGATWVTGRNGAALSFDGIDDLLTVPDDDSLDLGRGMTVSAWVHVNERPQGRQPVVVKPAGNDDAYALYAGVGDGEPASSVWLLDGQRIAASRSPLPVGRWVHLAMTYDGVHQRLYVDGVAVASRRILGSLRSADSAMLIGGSALAADGNYAGRLDDLRVYGRALYRAEIEELDRSR